MRAPRGLLVALMVMTMVMTVVALDAAPASAHSIGGREPTNVRNRVIALDPPVAGVEVRVVELGGRLEVRNTGDDDVVVLGYAGEPYLRVGPDGAFENRRSPAVFQNRTSDPPAVVPSTYDATAPPEWRKLHDGRSVRWHDHRAHAMQSGSFARSGWAVNLRVGSESVVVRGEFEFVPAPSWWPWLLLAAAVAVLVAVAARRWWRAAVAGALSLLVVGEIVHIAASWTDIASTTTGRAVAQLIPIAAIVIGLIALTRVARTAPGKAAPWVLLAAVVLVVAGGIGDVSAWYHSQLPTALAPAFARALVALAFGGSAGLAIAAAAHLRPEEPETGRTGPAFAVEASRPR